MAKSIKVSLVECGDRPWQLRWRDPRTRRHRWKSTATYDGDEAETIRAELERQLNDGTYRDRVLWESFRERYRSEHLSGLRRKSVAKAELVLDDLARATRPQYLSDIDSDAIGRWLVVMRQSQRQPWTIRNYLGALRAALHWAEEVGLCVAPKIPRVRVPRTKPRSVPAEVVERLFAAEPSAHWRAYLSCGWWAGLRLAEAWQLRNTPTDQHPWVDWEGAKIVLPAAACKSNEDQAVPLHPVLAEILKAIEPEGDRLFALKSSRGKTVTTDSGLCGHIRRIAKRAGVRVTMHDLRRGFGSRLAAKVPAAILQSLMRHADIQTTMAFYANVDDRASEAMAGLD